MKQECRWSKSPFILLIKSLSSDPTSCRNLFWQLPAESKCTTITWNIRLAQRTHTRHVQHTGRITHLLTAWEKACRQVEDPYSRLCKAVRRPGGVTRAGGESRGLSRHGTNSQMWHLLWDYYKTSYGSPTNSERKRHLLLRRAEHWMAANKKAQHRERERENLKMFSYSSCRVYISCQRVYFVILDVQAAAVVVAVLLWVWKTGKCVPTLIRWLIRLLNCKCPQLWGAAYLRSESRLRRTQIFIVLTEVKASSEHLRTLNKAL